MTSQPFFKMEIKNLFGIQGRGIVFEGTVLEGTVSIGDKLEYFEIDGTKILAVVKKILIKEEAKLFGIFSSSTAGKEIKNATQGQQVSIMVWDLFNVVKQSNFSPALGRGSAYMQQVSNQILQSFIG